MREAFDQVSRDGLSPSARYVLALVVLLLGVAMIVSAPASDASILLYGLSGFCAFVAAGCLTSGRVRQFILSTLGIAVFLMGLAYIWSQAVAGTLVSRRSDPSLLNALLFMGAFGVPGAGYALRARFGFGAPASSPGPTRGQVAPARRDAE